MRPLARLAVLTLAVVHVAAALPCTPTAAEDPTHGHHAHAATAHGDHAPAQWEASCPCGCGEPRNLHSGQRLNPAVPSALPGLSPALAWLELTPGPPRLPDPPALAGDPVPV